ncbi:MAG: flavin reductase family protein [Hyphomicrobiaceae bacterium]|jgi:flavin reductase (DIM6/NTAB) family NADH-FMN oxidoreductase RutF
MAKSLPKELPKELNGRSSALIGESALDERHLRNALGRFVTGVTVITTHTPDGRLEGLTVNSFSAVSLDPPLVLWSLRAASSCLPGFESAGHFAVNVLGTWQFDLSQHFARRGAHKFQSITHASGLGGCPLLHDALATFECSKQTRVVGGDHVVFFGRVERAVYREGEPLVFGAGKYGTHSPLE